METKRRQEVADGVKQCTGELCPERRKEVGVHRTEQNGCLPTGKAMGASSSASVWNHAHVGDKVWLRTTQLESGLGIGSILKVSGQQMGGRRLSSWTSPRVLSSRCIQRTSHTTRITTDDWKNN